MYKTSFFSSLFLPFTLFNVVFPKLFQVVPYVCSRFFSFRFRYFLFRFCDIRFCDNLSLNFECFYSDFSKVVFSVSFCRSFCIFTSISASSLPITMSDPGKSKRTSFSSASDKTLFHLIEKSSEIGTSFF